MNLKTRNVLFLDLQTTGAKPGSAHILEVAWGSLHSEEIESHLVQQPEGLSIPRQIQFITGIGDQNMDQAITLSKCFSLLKEYLDSRWKPEEEVVAIIHFAQFERPFLLEAYAQLQQPLPFSLLCTHEIAKRLLPNLPTRGIKGLAGYFGIPSGELKRAANHVQATQVIWQGLIAHLAEKEIHTLEELRHWLQATPKVARVKYEYPLPKEKRLGLPKQPGIYRMLSKWGEVLYVGKATSLHDRVNSYFRGQKNRDTRKLEMLTQVWDLQVTPVGSPLEAALLETDEIKRLDPPYNICLKAGRRNLAFFNHDFTSMSEVYDEEHRTGPFSNSMVLDSMIRLSSSLQSGIFDPNIFFEAMDPTLLKEGFEIFCSRHHFKTDIFCSVRSILAVGLNWLRKSQEEPQLEVEPELEVEVEAELETTAAPEKTPEEIADKFERHFLRAGKAYLRTKKLNRLLNSDIHFKLKNKSKSERILKIRQGQIVSNEKIDGSAMNPWRNFSIDTYDRMTVLITELEKLSAQKHYLKIKTI